MKMGIIEEVRLFVEQECKKSTSKYGYEPYSGHFIPTTKYAKILAEKLRVDIEVVELAAWLHDIGSIIYGRENHHITGSKIAEKKLRELGYPEDKIKEVVHCVFSHRGSQSIKRETVEAQIIAEVDGMAAFDGIGGLFKAALVYEKLSQEQARGAVRKKLINSFNKLSSQAKEIIKPKYEAAMLLLK